MTKVEHPQPAYRDHLQIGGDFAPGSDVDIATPASIRIAIHGSSRLRARFEADGAGTLRAYLLRAPNSVADLAGAANDLDDLERYSTGNPADVTIVADTEALLEIPEIYGEAYIEIEFTPDADNTTITFLDVCQL